MTSIEEARAAVERTWRDAGWGDRLSWPVPEAGPPPLRFSLRLPLGWEPTPLPLRGGDDTPSGRLRQWGLSGHAIALIGLVCRLPRDGGGTLPLVASVAVTLAELAGPETPPTGDMVLPVAAGSMSGWEARSTRRVPATTGGPEIEVLTVRYLLRSAHGTLALVCSAPQAVFHDELGRLFGAVIKTVRLDPTA